jgi:xanthine dehydrogenase accessory factor
MNIWKFIQTQIKQQTDVMLMVVAESIGSSSGRPGFKMAVSQRKELFGSIGGGNMEYEMVELAYFMVKSGKTNSFIKRQVHSEGNDHERSGAICSGEQTILFFPLNNTHLQIIDQIIQAIETNGQGAIRIANDSFGYLPGYHIKTSFQATLVSSDKWEYIEKIGRTNKICIIGAGHVGLALSKIMKDLDFSIEIYDDRLGLNTFEKNEFVNKKHKIDYNEIDELLPEGDHVYVVIMTFGHLSDEFVLKKIIRKNFKYLGMMGSKAKVKKIFENIGYNASLNEKKIFAPIGLPIHSQTPAEIAVSIAAEIIRVKNAQE